VVVEPVPTQVVSKMEQTVDRVVVLLEEDIRLQEVVVLVILHLQVPLKAIMVQEI
jgi:hypothetical protein